MAKNAVELAQRQLCVAQNEEKEVELFLESVEKRYEVIDVFGGVKSCAVEGIKCVFNNFEM